MRQQWLIRLITLSAFLLALPGIILAEECTERYGDGSNLFTLATGSPGELGLLKMLAEAFNQENKTTLCWVKAGSGESLKMLKAKEVDIALVHAPAAEKAAIQEGWAIKRTLIGSNEFYIVGSENDPAGIKEAKSATEAYLKIAAARAAFLSRGDNSGTHKKEISIWKAAGIEPAGDWYVVTKEFMMATMKKANDLPGYFMTDSSTWVAAKKEMKNLVVLFRGDPVLINTYHGLCQPAGATEGQARAEKFIDFIASSKGQEIIANYGKSLHGEGLYNDAAYAKQYDH